MSSLVLKALTVWSNIQSFLLKLPVIGSIVDLVTLSICTTFLRFGSGGFVASNIEKCERPEEPLMLYEYEFCLFCKKVREVLCILDLDCIIYPCPRETLTKQGFISKQSRYRNVAKDIGGKAQFPLLIDPNVKDPNNNDNKPLFMYESDHIIKYLFNKYGNNAQLPLSYKIAQLTGMIPLWMTVMVRNLPQNGLLRIPSRKPEQMLELWEFEACPFCKRVREVLSCLELPYMRRTAARGSSKRKLFNSKYGHLLSEARKKIAIIQVPLLVDPNTNTVMLESSKIVKYLYDTYKVGEMKSEAWDQWQAKKN